jgi:hypothetical protein
MTRDDILRMAREACETTSWKPGLGNEHVVEFMARFAALVAAAEREACARVVEDVEPSLSPIINMANRLAAAVIRARGQQQ